MKTLLRIDASIRLTGSHTRELTNHFETAWLRANPGGRVMRRCLANDAVEHLSQPSFDVIAPESAALIEELTLADHIVIGSPLYNFGVPSALKAYFDHVVRAGQTFAVEQGQHRGLLGGKRATLITARGGNRSAGISDDFQQGHLRQLLAFIGIAQVDVVSVEGTGADARDRRAAMDRARQAIDRLLEPPVWLGTFSARDRDEIEQLRSGQANAIMAGDAEAYAALCSEDIQLLIPTRELAAGKERFLEAQQALFRSARFCNFRKTPVRVERSGDLAVEVGRQQVQMETQGQVQGIFAAHQKYTHVFRHTPDGWRFAVLMSNPSE